MWLKNFPLKLTALGLAFLLWFHIATDRVYDYDAVFALGAAPLPAGFALAEPLPDQVRVRMSGSGKELIRLLWDVGRAELLLEPWLDTAVAITPNRLTLSVSADVMVQQVLEPAIVNVVVDTVIQQPKRVRFQGEFTTEAGQSLVRSPVLEPDQVTLTGPRRKVEAIPSVATEPLDFQVLKSSVTHEVHLIFDDAYNVTADPQVVNIRFDVAPSVRREVAGIPVQAPAGYKTDPPNVTFSVAGAEERLAILGAEYYRAAITEAAEMVADSFYSVEATVPPLVEILAVSPDRVRVYKR